MPNTYDQQQRWKKKHRDLYLKGKARNNKRRQERITAFLQDYKSQHPCVCGEADPIALDCHHIDPSKKNGKSINRLSMTKLIEELKLCIVLCSNCHRKGHAGRPRSEHISYFS